MNAKAILKNNTVLSPMAGYTDKGFRALACRYGAGLTVTEMVSAISLCMNNRIAKDLLRADESETPRAVQLFGSRPEVFAQVIDMGLLTGFDVIDVNMGCPMPKVTRNGEGSALMLDTDKACAIVKAIKKVWQGVVSVKFRSGVYDDSLAPDFAKALVQSGADMLTVHARTAMQMYSGKADWCVIAKVVRAVSDSDVTVIGNGDVVDRKSYLDMLNQTGCYGVAVGRGALGKPYIFSQLSDVPFDFDLLEAISYHYGQLSFLPERVLINEMRKHLAQYLHGKEGNRKILPYLNTLTSVDEVLSALSLYLRECKSV